MKRIYLVGTILVALVAATALQADQSISPLGRPAFTPAPGLAHFLVWQDFSGWHVRWGGSEDIHAYSGEIKAKSAKFGRVKEIFPYLKKKAYRIDDNKIVFDIEDNKIMNGLDFATNAQDINFKLLIDGRGCLDCIFIGASAGHPDRFPFHLTAVSPGIQPSGLNPSN